jgi:hypothetical protein
MVKELVTILERKQQQSGKTASENFQGAISSLNIMRMTETRMM